MGDDCRGCRKWEEEIYWSHFKCVQFFQTLSGDYRQQLAIPKKFSSNLKGVLAAGTVTLRGPSGAIWNVGLTRNDDTLFFKYGWKEFIEDHSLEENQLLVFKYKGNSSFDVLIFDHRSFCEKEASYFVKQCGHTEVGSGSKARANAMETFELPDDGPSQDVVEHIPPKKTKNNTTSSPFAGLHSRVQERSRRKTKISENIPTHHGKGVKRSFLDRLQLKSHRRPVTEEEKEKALRMAEAAVSSRDSLTVVMRTAQVYEKFYLTIPAKWAKDHLNDETQLIMLRTGERKWYVTFQHRVYGGLLTGGWKKFATENFLEEFDVCTFSVASRANYGTGLVLDVHIFRVVEDVVPPSEVTASSSGGSSAN